MFSRCPFFNRGNLEKTSNYTRTIFLTVCQNNYDNRVLFRNVLVFSYENQVFCIKIRRKKRMSHNPPRKIFFSSQKTVRKNFSQGVMTHPWKKKYFFLGGYDSPLEFFFHLYFYLYQSIINAIIYIHTYFIIENFCVAKIFNNKISMYVYDRVYNA